MKNNIINFFKSAFPFLLTVGLWRLSDTVWNPAGILAMIPIFYCSVVRQTDWFVIFSIAMCVCLDYKFETVCLWLAMYCLFYAINGFQTIIDITRMDKNGIMAFMLFIGVTVIILFLQNMTFANLGRGVWIFVWTSLLYQPITLLIQRVQHD